MRSQLIEPTNMNFVPKTWGWELWITNNEKYCGKKLFIKQGHFCSYHHHKLKSEVLFVDSGSIWFTHSLSGISFRTIKMEAGFAFQVEPEFIHQMHAIQDAVIFEFSTQHFDSDSIRQTTHLMDPYPYGPL